MLDARKAILPRHYRHIALRKLRLHGKRAKLYEKRQQLLNLGADALALLTEITHREPRLSGHRVEELYELLERHGDNVMRAAIAHAVEGGELSIAGVRRAIDARVEGIARVIQLQAQRATPNRGTP